MCVLGVLTKVFLHPFAVFCILSTRILLKELYRFSKLLRFNKT